ncbi:FHA domain-containing protein [Besnoitia besnoiti]|uniref:FHA domain-containing protein n=1 Tax=Besnoitia besnoiti TaxID=94643 RepID=A0A2A9MMP6_BESBE|nr:FHA domain-containing protein [Besnoitia besnoiti]PFH36870.1 FHA domain-containing protein [Besnoitia besnoiti]
MTTPFTPAAGRGGVLGRMADPQGLLTPAHLAAAARCMYTRIDSFTGEYKFLSLDYPCLVFFQGRFFPSARHALLASRYPKAVDELSNVEDIKTLKKVAKEKEEDPDWQRLRLKWLEHIQRDKFRRHADLREKLRNTGGRELVWLNNGDSFFGQIGNRGQNHLGRILMEIRNNINEDTELESWIVICHDIETDEKSLPVLKLCERKEGETQVTEILLKGKSFYRIGKLPDNDLVALNPSISRRHAALAFHLAMAPSRARTVASLEANCFFVHTFYMNGVALENDHVGVQIESNDVFSLGTSTRHYLLEVDNAGILEYLQRRSRELRRELAILEDEVDPEHAMNKSSNRIFVGGLAYNTSRHDICELFGPVGPIVDVTVPQVDRSIPADSEEAFAVRGIAFVEFVEKKDARTALELAGKYLCGRPITVNYANLTKEERAVQNALFADEKSLTSFVPATAKTFEHPTQRSLQTGVNVSPAGDWIKKKSRWDLHDDRTERNYGDDKRHPSDFGMRSEKEIRCPPPPTGNFSGGFSSSPPGRDWRSGREAWCEVEAAERSARHERERERDAERLVERREDRGRESDDEREREEAREPREADRAERDRRRRDKDDAENDRRKQRDEETDVQAKEKRRRDDDAKSSSRRRDKEAHNDSEAGEREAEKKRRTATKGDDEKDARKHKGSHHDGASERRRDDKERREKNDKEKKKEKHKK